jgi:hypothetical protein
LSPYAINWDTTTAAAGSNTLSAKATDTAGDIGISSNVTATVQNPAPPMTCFVMQADVNVHGSTTVTTPTFHTAAAGEVLLAFVSADGPTGSGQQHTTVSGAGLTWTLVKRANSQPGDAEVWRATAPTVLSSATVTSTASAKGFGQSLTVIAMEGVSGIGASVAGSAGSGAPKDCQRHRAHQRRLEYGGRGAKERRFIAERRGSRFPTPNPSACPLQPPLRRIAAALGMAEMLDAKTVPPTSTRSPRRSTRGFRCDRPAGSPCPVRRAQTTTSRVDGEVSPNSRSAHCSHYQRPYRRTLCRSESWRRRYRQVVHRPPGGPSYRKVVCGWRSRC